MSPSKPNNENQAITLATYAKDVERYITETSSVVEGTLQDYLDRILEHIPAEAEILEIGSATGRDADYIESRGYQVQRSDAVEGFVTYMQQKGTQAITFNVLTDTLDKKYDAIIATAVFLHFTDEQFTSALMNLHNHLRKDGVMMLAVKPGAGEEYTDRKMGAARYFKYWDEIGLSRIVSANGFTVINCEIISDGLWLECIAKKA